MKRSPGTLVAQRDVDDGAYAEVVHCDHGTFQSP
jgi:hypothetical protein